MNRLISLFVSSLGALFLIQTIVNAQQTDSVKDEPKTKTAAADSVNSIEPTPTENQTAPMPPVDLTPLKLSTNPLLSAHAHNDYYHERPLIDALSAGFTSIEADVFLKDGQLLVGHYQFELQPYRSLRRLYLEPLNTLAKRNGGRIYPSGPELILLIDIKADGKKAFAELQKLLDEFPDLISSMKDGQFQQRAVRVIFSGDRPVKEIQADANRVAGIDGRAGDLQSTLSPDVMPLISEQWGQHFKWRGRGKMPADQRTKLDQMIQQAHRSGRKIRFWATPESTTVWSVLREAQVDLIGTDQLEELKIFLEKVGEEEPRQ